MILRNGILTFHDYKFKILLSFFLLIITTSHKPSSNESFLNSQNVELIVLGTIQDGGAPHINCNKSYCNTLRNKGYRHRVVSLGIIDHSTDECWIFEATPDFPSQRDELLKEVRNKDKKDDLDGIFLTHAHIGHYSGLMFLGKEAMNSSETKVYCMPRMAEFLSNNGPWDQLVELNNIDIEVINESEIVILNENIKVTSFAVPHRDEYSETVGYEIIINDRRVLFIPDIDKWKLWDRDINEIIKESEMAFLDATFFGKDELKGRDMSEIPHPFITESMDRFLGLEEKDKRKVKFIHLNHSNPALDTSSTEFKYVNSQGYSIAQEGDKFYFHLENK